MFILKKQINVGLFSRFPGFWGYLLGDRATQYATKCGLEAAR